MSQLFIAKTRDVVFKAQPTLWFVFQNDNILLDGISPKAQIPMFSGSEIPGVTAGQKCYLGLYGNIPCFAVQIDTSDTPQATAMPSSWGFHPVRQALAMMDDEAMFAVVIRAMQFLHWDRRTRFCGCCGEKTSYSDTESAKICARCNTLFYSQISPVMLVLIARRNEILLARAPHFAPGVYSLLAGFVEPGETLEQCVIREVKEEVNLAITNIRYYASQPWPFPSNLMMGFFADYHSGEILIDTKELEEARWYPVNKLPLLPNHASLSRRMIDAWQREQIQTYIKPNIDQT